jgi:hypothetical protein
MKTPYSNPAPDGEDDLEAEYAFDHSKAKPNRFAMRDSAKTMNVIALDEDIAQAFPTAETVNKALRQLIEPNKLAETKLQRHAHIATIAAGVTAFLTLWSGLFIFHSTSESQNQTSALAMLQVYFERAIENPDLAYRDPSGKFPDFNNLKGNEKQKHQKYVMFASNVLFTAETIYNMEKGESSWEQTVKGLVDNHLPFIFSNEFPCKEYDARFIAFIRKEFDKSKETLCR